MYLFLSQILDMKIGFNSSALIGAIFLRSLRSSVYTHKSARRWAEELLCLIGIRLLNFYNA
jgi:hypothetical protein